MGGVLCSGFVHPSTHLSGDGAKVLARIAPHPLAAEKTVPFLASPLNEPSLPLPLEPHHPLRVTGC